MASITSLINYTGTSSSAASIKELQTALKGMGLYSGAIDGIYGSNTVKAVTAYKSGSTSAPLGSTFTNSVVNASAATAPKPVTAIPTGAAFTQSVVNASAAQAPSPAPAPAPSTAVANGQAFIDSVVQQSASKPTGQSFVNNVVQQAQATPASYMQGVAAQAGTVQQKPILGASEPSGIVPQPTSRQAVDLANANVQYSPSATPSQTPQNILASTPRGQQMQQSTYQSALQSKVAMTEQQKVQQGQAFTQDVVSRSDVLRGGVGGGTLEPAPTATGTSGTGSSGSGSGGYGSGGGTGVQGTGGLSDYISPELMAQATGTGMAVSENGTIIKEPNIYFDALMNMKFEYDPATDKGYLQAVAQAENAIIQSIIGRGGLYSSVARDAVAVKLADLAIEYETMAYEKFVNERTYMFQLAQYEQNRIDTLWEQNFKVNSFQAEQEQIKFTNALNLAEFQFQLDKEAYNQRMAAASASRASNSSYVSGKAAQANATIEQQTAQISNLLNANLVKQTQLQNYAKQWAASGRASKEVANFFSAYGVQVGSRMSDFRDAVNSMSNQLNNDAFRLTTQLSELGEAKMAADWVNKNTMSAPEIKTVEAPTATPLTAAQKQRYY